MRKLTGACLWVLIAVLTAAPGWAEKKHGPAPPLAQAQNVTNPGQTGDVPEARELIQRARACEAHRHPFKAMSLYEQALQLRDKALGPDNPLTVACMARLARLYSILGFFDKALPLAQRSLQFREKVLGPDNPLTARSLMIMGYLYEQMGASDKALPMMKEALRISEKALGPLDLQTASALHNLAVIYSQMGDYGQALPLAQRAAKIREQVF
jgi:tetratricopeptide (TPR) repeat protein